MPLNKSSGEYKLSSMRINTNTSADLFRKSLYFSPQRWADLQAVMADMSVSSPSLAIEELVISHIIKKTNKGAVNAQSTRHQQRI